MNESFVKIYTNWELVHGNIANTLLTKIVDSNSSIDAENSDLSDIASFDRSVHLNEIAANRNENNDNEAHKCEICLEVSPRFLANKITVITDCQKMEIFLNIQDEYLRTVYGELVDDFDGIKVYRFDIVLNEKLCCVKVLLKLIPKAPDIWIYGIQLELHPNLFREFINHSNINLENVQNILTNSKQKLSPSAVRCKAFLESYMGRNLSAEKNSYTTNQNCLEFLNNSSIQSFLQSKNLLKLPAGPTTHLDFQKLSLTDHLENKPNNFNAEYLQKNDLNGLKEFFLNKILETENKILQKLEQIEQREDEKLNKILKLLEK